jgi:hypothetical protein
VQLNTLRWAIIDQLRRPRPGFEDVTRGHFRLLRHRVLAQAQAWLRAAADTKVDALHCSRLADCIVDLHRLLTELSA